MNLSRALTCINRGRWEKLFPFSAAQYHQGRQYLNLFGDSQNQKTKPVLLFNIAHYTVSSSVCFSVISQQSYGISKSLLTQRRLLMLQRESLHTLWHNNESLPHRYIPGCTTPIQQHLHTNRNPNHRRGDRRTKAPKESSEKRDQQTQTEDDGGKHNSKDENQMAWALDTEEDLKQLSEEIVKRAGEKDVMVRSVSLRQLEELVLGLHQCGWKGEDILTTLTTHPSLLHHRSSILPTVHLLLDLGFGVDQVISIVQLLPVIVRISKSQINDVMDTLRGCGFGEGCVFRLVSNNPSLLLLSSAAVSERVSALRQLFKSADVITLGLKCPRLLSDDWAEIQAKFDYVFHEMDITQKQMVYASLFNHSLSHIKQRHTFLVRAGLFSTAKRQEGEKSPNATLDKIVAASDKTFCRKFGNFQVKEYHVFCELFDKEQAALELEDSDSDEENVGK